MARNTNLEQAQKHKAVPVRIESRIYIALTPLALCNRRSLTAEINDILANHITVQEAWPD